MKTYIDERPFELMILDAVPSGKYQYIEDMIRRENTIFRGDHTIYDLSIWKMEQEQKEIQKDLQAIADKMTADAKLREAIAEAQNQPKKPGKQEKKPILGKPMDSKEFEELFSEKLELQGRQKELEEKIWIWKQVQDVAQKEFVSLNRVAKLYKKTGDEDILKKGVHWTCAYADRLLLNIPSAMETVPGLIRPPPHVQNLNDGAW